MIGPVICFTCGRQITLTMINGYKKVKEERAPQSEINKKAGIISYNDEISYVDFFEKHGIRRLCCRTRYTTGCFDGFDKIA